MKNLIQIFRISFLVLAAFILCVCCRKGDEERFVTVVTKDDKAVAVEIVGMRLDDNEVSSRVKVQLIKTGERIPILGDFRIEERKIIFEPVVPFTRGLRYEVLLDDKLFLEMEVPVGDAAIPKLLAIYPSQDTLPENLLKMYFEFTEPMVESSSLSHIILLRSDGDTMQGTFLDLQPELWNSEGTVLTLWLDPGRIKRELIPNKELGTPLKANEKYTLHVNQSLKSKNGASLLKNYTKTFITTHRDEVLPDPSAWRINIPSAGGKQPLSIILPHALDYFLLKEGITIHEAKGGRVSGVIEINDEERVVKFIPNKSWSRGSFLLNVESRLEDLAGNNLNRPFDQDVSGKSVASENNLRGQQGFVKEFQIQ
ncbi:hypothetical protein [Chryseolinea sp. H1M3-3]|uniref:Ig-like domain-containing protein n=1 Tax=Chryseolinea sp. H1M3-3 TaxID=3034144 RepID=UPI0023EAD374|nr:hypothetical protein [Chryseolinea sp. H1M3-3]